MTSRSYCITVFPEVEFKLWDKLPEGIKYMVFQFEICPKTNKLHIQGYVDLCQPMRFKQVQEILRTKCHCEKRKGTPTEARDYCMKEKSRLPGTKPIEFGVFNPGKPGARNDLNGIKDLIEQGGNFKDCCEENFAACARYGKFFKEYIAICEKDKPENKKYIKRNVVYDVGKTGTGKTRRAFEEMKDPWIKPNGPWFDGYNGENDVIIDEFRGDIPISTFLRILDGYPCTVPFKGGFTQWKATNIRITSNIEPNMWYPGLDDDTLAAMHRRMIKLVQTDK